MSTIVETYLKVGEHFIPLKEYTGTLPDENYIQGAVVCRINDRQILTTEHWDLVDQLWVYILLGLSRIKRGEGYDVFFPDQPLRLRFMPISAYCVEVTIGNECQRFDLHTFVTALAEGAVEFFKAMKRLLPSASETWDRYFLEATSLMNC